MRKTESHLAAMIDSVLTMSRMIKEMGTATHEQTQALGRINHAVSRISTMTHNNSGVEEQVSRAAGALNGHAACLHRAVHVFGGS